MSKSLFTYMFRSLRFHLVNKHGVLVVGDLPVERGVQVQPLGLVLRVRSVFHFQFSFSVLLLVVETEVDSKIVLWVLLYIQIAIR